VGARIGVRPEHNGITFSPAARQRSQMAVTFDDELVGRFVERRRAGPGKHIWMTGGAGVASSFLDAGAIDEFSIHVVPVLIGKG
jgi:dihydrofolate reductase